MTAPGWIAVDWGTSSLRAWAMDGDRVLDERRTDEGAGGLDPTGFERVLIGLIERWLGPQPVSVIACGMVGSRQGWAEAPYRKVPCEPLDGLMAVAGTDQRIRLSIVPGLSQEKPADVIRGEETQIAGFLSHHPDFDGVLCLPGTHTKWVRISAGEVVHFRTAMTGEIFGLMAGASVLRHAVGARADWDEAAFEAGVDDTMSRPERILTESFTLRARALLEGMPPAIARARLSGLLIGAELAAMKPYWLGQDVAIIGAEALSERYRAALALTGLEPRIAPAAEMTRAGLLAARERISP